MGQTKAGGAKVKATILRKYGPDYYSKLGMKGGAVRCFKGFATNKDLAKEAGRKGGLLKGPSKYRLIGSKPTGKIWGNRELSIYTFEVIKTGERLEVESISRNTAYQRITRGNY